MLPPRRLTPVLPGEQRVPARCCPGSSPWRIGAYFSSLRAAFCAAPPGWHAPCYGGRH